MTTDIKAGDRVRRTEPHLHGGPNHINVGDEFTVASISRNGGLILKGKSDTYNYSPSAFEKIENPTRLSVGDKVRVNYEGEVDRAEDGDEGIRVVSNDRRHYDRFTQGATEGLVTVTTPADPEAEARAVWNSLKAGDRFTFNDSPEGIRVKVDDETFGYEGGSIKFKIESFLRYGITPKPPLTVREEIQALKPGQHFTLGGRLFRRDEGDLVTELNVGGSRDTREYTLAVPGLFGSWTRDGFALAEAPVRTYQDEWNDLPVGAEVPGASGDSQNWVKVDNEHFTLGGVGHKYRTALYREKMSLPVGTVSSLDFTPVPQKTLREMVNALADGTRFSVTGSAAPNGSYIKLETDRVWPRVARKVWNIDPDARGTDHYGAVKAAYNWSRTDVEIVIED